MPTIKVQRSGVRRTRLAALYDRRGSPTAGEIVEPALVDTRPPVSCLIAPEQTGQRVIFELLGTPPQHQY
jgi:hypothetical protein